MKTPGPNGAAGAGDRWQHAFGRFLVSGAFNTGATYVLYLALMQAMPYRTAYSISYMAGIALAYALNRYFVFRAKGSLSTMARFPAVYLVQYLLGLGVVSLWGDVLHWPKALAPLAAVVVTIPLTFLISKRLFTGK